MAFILFVLSVALTDKMSLVPGTEVLSNPSSFARNDNVPIDIAQSHGVPTDFGNIAGIGQVDTLYDGAKDYNSGVNATNRPLTETILCSSAKFGINAYHHEDLCFINEVARMNPSLANGAGQVFNILGLSKMNAYCKSPEGRIRYGNETTATKLKTEWRFFGSVKRITKAMWGDDAVAIVFGGRCRLSDIGRSYAPKSGRNKPYKGVVGQRDHLFLTYRRYDMKDELNQELIDAGIDPSKVAPDLSNGTVVPTFYWKLDFYINRNGQQPPIQTYTDEYNIDESKQFIGDYLHLGYIHFVYGNRAFKQDHVVAARRVVAGEEGYQKDQVSLPAVELHIGVH